MYWHRIKNFLKYYFRATTRYDVHSPAVFALLNDLYRPLDKSTATNISYYKNKLYNLNLSIENIDKGAGSSITQNQKTINLRSILRNAVSPNQKLALLHQISSHFKSKRVLELGTSLGFSALALTHPSVEKLTTVEGNPHIAELARQMFDELQIKVIDSRVGDFMEVILSLTDQNFRPDLIYIDGNHTYEATMTYHRFFLKHYSFAPIVLIYDDLYWSPGMTKAWQEIKSDHQTIMSIDLY